MQDFKFLVSACVYKELLDVISILSLLFEKEHLNAFDILPHVQKTSDQLTDLLTSDFAVDSCGIQYNPDTREIKCDLPKSDHMRRKPENREFVTVCYTGILNISD
ncbi:Uncharacterised protein at_DN0161, partial [Pycnogonum litorale]